MRVRWITIGVVQTGWFVFQQQSGTPDGLLMSWRGRIDCVQPLEFRCWEYLFWAVERRLHLAKLQWVAIASEVQRPSWCTITLRVLVRRQMGRQQRPPYRV